VFLRFVSGVDKKQNSRSGWIQLLKGFARLSEDLEHVGNHHGTHSDQWLLSCDRSHISDPMGLRPLWHNKRSHACSSYGIQ